MKVMMWVVLSLMCVLVSMVAVEASSRHHTKPPKSHSLSLGESLDYFTSRPRKSKGIHGRNSKRKSHSWNAGNVDQALFPEARKQKVWLNFTEANRQIAEVIKNRYKNETDMLTKPAKQDGRNKKKKDCHSIAMLQCGCEAMKSFEQTLKVMPFVKVETRCAVRKRFFECLGNAVNASESECKRHNLRLLKPKSAYQRHKKEIVRVLWSTRECLLGQVEKKREKVSAKAELKINSGFCRKLVQQKNGRHRKVAKKHSSRSKPTG